MDDGARRLDTYMKEMRRLLRGLPEAEVSEIVAELRSHVHDSGAEGATSESDVAAALDRLGSPEELASLYRTDRLLVRAGRGGSPWLLPWSLLRWASVSVAGGLVLLTVVAGYVVAASFLVAALVKPFAPDRAGLWWLGEDTISLHLGLSAPPPGQELLGWWIVPLGLLMGYGAFSLASRFGRWAIRRFRRSPLGPAA